MHSNATSPAAERSRATNHRKASQIENAPKRNRSSIIRSSPRYPWEQRSRNAPHRTHPTAYGPPSRAPSYPPTEALSGRALPCARHQATPRGSVLHPQCWVNHKTTLSHLRSKRAFKENAAAYSCTATPTREPYCQLCMKSTQRQRSHTLRTTSSGRRTTARVMRCALA